jgi:drug/metabolite transporter (DMT)-like permease
MTALLSLLSALLYGSADFAGGLASRRNSVFSVMLLSQAAGLVAAFVVAPLLGSRAPGLADLGWGFLAGLTGSVGLAFLYRGLAEHQAAIVSPLSALGGAILPAAFGAALGERPSALALIGAGLCLPAILLLSYERSEAKNRPELRASIAHGLAAGAGFGCFFIFISRSSPLSGLWPLVASRGASMAATGLLIAVGRKGLAVRGRDRPIALLAGAADMGANICFLLASRSGLLILVTLITSLFPAPTVILARVFQGQRISAPRAAGMAFALAGVALIGLR